MSAPISPRHRPSADQVPDGMSLLYADLPPKPEDPHSRDRVDLAVTVALAAVGAVAAGTGIAGDLIRRFVRDEAENAEGTTPESTVPTGVERVVGALAVPGPVLGTVSESEFAPPLPEDVALAEIEPAGTEPALPPTAAPPRDATLSSSRPLPPPPVDVPATTVPAAIVPSTTVPAATVPSTTVPSTTVPSTTVPASTVPPSTTTPSPDADPQPEARAQAYVLAAAAGYEVTPAAAVVIEAAGIGGWVDQQLAPASIPDPALEDVLTGFDLVDRPLDELLALGLEESALSEARWAGFARSAFSERQVETQMASVWRRWFALPLADVAAQLELDRIVRRHALGSYPELVGAVAVSAGLARSHGIDDLSVAAVVDSSLAQRVLVDWVLGADGQVDDSMVDALAEAIVAGPEAAVAHLTAVVADPAAAAHVGGMIGGVIAGDGAPAMAAAIEAFGRGAAIGDCVRACLLDGRINADRPASGVTWLVRSLRRVGATVTVGGPWEPSVPGSIAGLLRVLGASSGVPPRADEDEGATAVASRWEAARSITAGGVGIAVDLAAPGAVETASELIDHVEVVAGVRLDGTERAALLDYLGVDAGTEVDVAAEVIADLVALALSFPSALRRVAVSA